MSRRAQTSQSYRANSSQGRALQESLGEGSYHQSNNQYSVGGGGGGGRLQQQQGSSIPQLPYGRPATSHRLIDKSSIIWRDFLNGVKRRKRTLNKLREVALDGSSTSGMLKRLLLEIRQMTLRVIEDALEIEYRSQFPGGGGAVMLHGSGGVTATTRVARQLPPIASYRGMEDKEDVLALADIITDTDDLFKVPAVRVFLPVEFPSTRNPFLLGKGVDELAEMVAPQPAVGNLEEELKVLELLRYKRAAKALLKAECQVLNRLPITLPDIERLWFRMVDDPHLDKLIRAVWTILHNDKPDYGQEPILYFLTEQAFMVEPHEFVNKLNMFRGAQPIRIDVQAAVRHSLRDAALEYMEDHASIFLIEWVNSVLSNTTTYFLQGGENNYGGIGGGDSTILSGMGSPSMTRAPSVVANPQGGGGALMEFRAGNVGRDAEAKSNNIKDLRYLGERAKPAIGGGVFIGGGAGGYGVGPNAGPTGQGGDYNNDLVSIVSALDDYTTTKKLSPSKLGMAPIGSMGKDPPNAMPPMKKTIGGSLQQASNVSGHDDGHGKAHEGGSIASTQSQSQLEGLPPKPHKHHKKKKETEKEKKKREKEEMNEKIRTEVERILQEQGIGKRPNTGNDLVTEQDTVTSLRYELVKMQQELLRRKVLDPRHYKVQSVDVQSLEAHGLTVPDGPATTGGSVYGSKKVKAPPRQMVLYEQEFDIDNETKCSVEIVLDLVQDSLVGKISRVMEVEEPVEEHEDPHPDDAPVVPIITKTKELIAIMPFTKLTLNRVTGFLLDNIVDEKIEARRNKKLELITNQLKEHAHITEAQSIQIIARMDRLLYKTSITVDGIALNVVVLRNEDCTGLTLQCTPLSSGMGSVDNGPISITVHDKELQVLLINQRGLYILSQSKWSCMEMVAQWLTSRIKVKKVRIMGPGDVVPTEKSKAAAIRAAKLKAQKEALAPPGAETDNPGSSLVKRVAQDSVSTIGLDFADLAPIGRSPTMLDVSLDRQVEIAQTAEEQWRSRNLPSIAIMTATLEAWQDIDTVRFEVALSFPHPKLRKAKKDEGKALMDFSRFDAVDSTIEKEDLPPVVINLTYRLTSSELAVFGAAEVMEERKISMSKKSSGEGHPSAFMWNILNRLKAVFKGSTSEPFSKGCKADDKENWELVFDRRLLRDIRTISGGVLLVTVSSIGSELLYECEPTDAAVYQVVGSKLFEEDDIAEMTYTEGWPLNILDYSQRTHLAFRILEKLKIITVNGSQVLEAYNFPESRMLQIYQQNVPGKPDLPLGTVEITDHHTMADLRVIIKHELDRDLVPRLYRFLYKGGPCAVRQEPFRRAWEVLPLCILIPRIQKLDANEKLAALAAKRKADLDKNVKKAQIKMRKDQRRVSGKLVPVPVFTLCTVQEETNEVFLLHDSRNLLVAGDVIRIGSTLARDYIVSLRSKALQNSHPKMITMDPNYDLIMEDDFDTPICGANYSPTPKTFPVDKKTGVLVLPPYSKWGFQYNIPEKPKVFDLAASLSGPPLRDKKKTRTVGEIQGGERDDEEETGMAITRTAAPDPKGGATQGTIWRDVWIWKCIPASEDKRPQWRINYDDGLVDYQYTYQESNEGEKHFRVKVYWKLMEVLCTDCRCPDMTIYAQRVNEMSNFSVDYYTKLAFKNMLEWFPQNKKGVESSKFMKLIRDMNIFPDIKRPARSGQMDLLFQKEVMSDNGIYDKYVNYVGLCRLLQDCALIRYPPPVPEGEEGSVKSGSVRDDSSVANTSLSGSISPSKGVSGSVASGSKDGIKRAGVSAPAMQNKDGKLSPMRGKKGKEATKEEKAAKEANNEQAIVDPEHASAVYRKVVVDNLMNIPEWAALSWNEAKLNAMRREGKRYCAATRIAAVARGTMWRKRYLFYLEQLISLQANIRRKLAKRRCKNIVKIIEQDWLFRLRYHAATICQALLRRYLSRAKFYAIMKRRKAEEIKMQKARRFRLKKVRQKEKKGIIYKETKRVNGIMVMLFINRKDSRNYSTDYGIVIGIYVPASSTTYKFPIEENNLRKYMCKELEVEAVGIGDLLDKRNLQAVVAARLIIRKAARIGMPPQILFSKQAMGQRGTKAMAHGRRIDGEKFVCTLYETGAEITVACYHMYSSKMFSCTIGTPALRDWVVQDHKLTAKNDIERHKEPEVLRPGNKRALHKWAIDRIRVDTRKGVFRVLFEVQLQKSKKGMYIMRIQALWRKAIVRLKIVKVYDQFLLKVKVGPEKDAACYYIDRRTGESQWEKPWLMGPWLDLTAQPSHRWVDLVYYHEGAYYQHYVNPHNGKFTHLTQDRASRIIQSLVRNKQLRAFSITKEEIARVVPFWRSAVKNYESAPLRLLNVINYALVAHLIELDEVLAKKLYIEAVELAEANPLVTRSFGLFVLGTCEAPIGPNRERAHRLLNDARRRDEEHDKFKLAYMMYKFACLRHPRDVRVLCNRALVDCYLYTQNWNGERLLRRALAIAPFEERVVEIWNYLKERFPDRQLAYNPIARIELVDTKKQGKKRIIHGRPSNEDPKWAGWVYIEEDTFKVSQKIKHGPYWYNPASGEELTKQPNFAEQWEIRRLRSQSDGEKQGLQHFFDPLTAVHFQWHEISNTYQ